MRIITISILLVLSAVSVARGDIYRYTDDEGTECFTDTPVAGKTRPVVREKRRSLSPKKKATLFPAAAKTAAVETVQADSGSLCLPLPGRVTSHVGLRNDPIDGRLKMHNGVDIAVAEGTTVRPVAGGKVVYSGQRGGYGNIVVIAHDNGMYTAYAHNSTNLVSEGTRVDSATPIALSGSTGHATGPHLHFEAWKDGVNITSSFLDNPSSPQPQSPVYASRQEQLRRVVQDDGSVLYTNIPPLHR